MEQDNYRPPTPEEDQIAYERYLDDQEYQEKEEANQRELDEDWERERQEQRDASTPRDIPENLWWHYTDANALIAIITNNTLRASALSFMNDFGELTFAMDETYQAALTIVDAEADEKLEDPLGKKNKVVSLFDFGTDYEVDPPRAFAACFSTKADSLANWIGYGKVSGYAIGFDPEKLPHEVELGAKSATTIRRVPIEKFDVKYGDEGRKYLVDEFRKNSVAKDISPAELTGLIDKSVCIKHEAYRHESEARLIIRSGAGLVEPPDVEFTTKNGFVVPYISIPFDSSAIAAVITGPSLDHRRKHTVRRLLDSKNYDPKFPLHTSKIKYIG